MEETNGVLRLDYCGRKNGEDGIGCEIYIPYKKIAEVRLNFRSEVPIFSYAGAMYLAENGNISDSQEGPERYTRPVFSIFARSEKKLEALAKEFNLPFYPSNIIKPTNALCLESL